MTVVINTADYNQVTALVQDQIYKKFAKDTTGFRMQEWFTSSDM
jgi:hypothetical protein